MWLIQRCNELQLFILFFLEYSHLCCDHSVLESIARHCCNTLQSQFLFHWKCCRLRWSAGRILEKIKASIEWPVALGVERFTS